MVKDVVIQHSLHFIQERTDSCTQIQTNSLARPPTSAFAIVTPTPYALIQFKLDHITSPKSVSVRPWKFLQIYSRVEYAVGLNPSCVQRSHYRHEGLRSTPLNAIQLLPQKFRVSARACVSGRVSQCVRE